MARQVGLQALRLGDVGLRVGRQRLAAGAGVPVRVRGCRFVSDHCAWNDVFEVHRLPIKRSHIDPPKALPYPLTPPWQPHGQRTC